ncbi:MAG TPA: lysylphosphatidylglycerol synthase domain-containing protein [Phnomibacter sp.]|nr:lysylphosphatidylglycerol synthase domain-containing protein [Phnomibacter sp.]
MPAYKKIKRFINYFLGPLLFVGISYSIYRQLAVQPQLGSHWQHIKEVFADNGKGFLGMALVLMFVNWGLESKKWQILTSHVQPTSLWTATKSVMAGVSFTMLTPNRMGEFLGRVLYLPDGSRVRAATLMLLSSISQLVITLCCGVAGIYLLKQWAPQLDSETEGWTWWLVNALLYGSSIFILLGLLIYFNIGWLIRQVERFPPFSQYAYYVHIIGEIHYLELLKLLGLSAIRYFVFLSQYALVFRFFEVGIPLYPLIACTMVMFLMLAIVPTIALAELGIRGQVSLFVFGLFSPNSLEILVAAAAIWFINIIFPAVAGSFMLLTVKLFRKT